MKFPCIFILLVLTCAHVVRAQSTQPTTQPARPVVTAFIVGVDPAAVSVQPPPTFTVPSAPATVHVSAFNVLTKPADWLDENDRWSFGDTTSPQTAVDPRTGQTIDLDQCLAGPVAAHIYESPGTYTVTLLRAASDGTTLAYIARVIVPEAHRSVYYISTTGNDSASGVDPTRALRSATAGAKRIADHVELRFERGGVYPIDRAFDLTHRDVVLDCFGDPNQPLPVIYRTPNATQTTQPSSPYAGPVVNTWPGKTADVTIRHLRFDSPYSIARAAGGYVYHSPAAYFGFLRGRNVTVADCEFANLFEGPHGDPTLTGSLLLRNRQVDPLGIPSRTLWLEGSDIVAIGNVATNSANESPLRGADTGIVRGLIAFNDIAQQLDPAHGRGGAKAAVTLRALLDVQISQNRIVNGELSFDPHTATAHDERIAVIDNTISNSVMRFRANCRHAVVRNNAVDNAGGPCICVANGDGVQMWNEDVRIESNHGQSWQPNGRMFLIDAGPASAVRNCSMDAAKNTYMRVAPPPATTPVAK